MGGATLDVRTISRAVARRATALRWAPAMALPPPAASSPVSEPATEVECVIAAQDGDRDAFGELYRRYSRMVHGVLLARIPRAQVEDLVQDVFLTALTRLGSLRDPERFGGWLAMIARNRATDFHRRARQTTELTDDVPGPAAPPDAEAEALWVLRILQTLPEAYRETLVLRLVEGMTGPEIAARTGMTEGSVRVNLHRGMKQLREKLEKVRDDV